MKPPALPLGTALVLVAFVLSMAALTAYLISRGNVQLETAVGLAIPSVLGIVVAFMRGLQPVAPATMGETPKPTGEP